MSIIKVKTGGITADAITDALIADDVVGTEHLTANEVDTAALGADAVTGAQLADNAVNSEHYTDGSVDTAHIADANVTTAKVADDAVTAAKINNDIISGSTELATAPADTDEFLVSDAGTLKRIDYSLIKGGGEWTKILHTTASDDATVVFNSTYITSTYQDYKVVYSNVHSASDRQNFELKLSIDNGSNITNVDSMIRLYKSDEHVSSRGQSNSATFQLHGNENSGNGTGESLSGSIEIFDPSATDTRKHILGRTIFNLGDSGVVHSHSVIGASTRVTDAVNYLRFNWASGNIASGEFTLYGRKI